MSALPHAASSIDPEHTPLAHPVKSVPFLSHEDTLFCFEASYTNQRLATAREFRAARDAFAAIVRNLEPEHLDAILKHHDQESVLNAMAEFDAPARTDAEIEQRAGEDFREMVRDMEGV